MSHMSARVALLAATSLSMIAMAAPASANAYGSLSDEKDRRNAQQALAGMSTGTGWNADHRIIINHLVTPGVGDATTGANYANSSQVLDTSGVNGVGQQISIDFPFLGLCTGTLINPRTVITAAHCVYDAPQEFYGSVTGVGGGVPAGQGLPASNGIPISFGFQATNRCRGIAVNGCVNGTGPYEVWRDSGYKTQTALSIYNGNQVWYHEEATKEFGLGDIALVTLDTHADNIPTWTLLFSPLQGPAHATITGYGGAGVGLTPLGDLAGIDYRRRVAENMVDALMSSDDWASSPAQGRYQGFSHYAHSLYWMDFDDPTLDYDNLPDNFFVDTSQPCAPGQTPTLANNYCGRDNGYYDFNGLGGTALDLEGSTAGGDSGGPLIIDQTFSDGNGGFKPVVAGVLTGGWSYNGGIGTYGEYSVYPPLFLYWQDIVRQNPYKYVSALAGDGDWFDPTHWVQDMDPNYAIIGADGELVNALPTSPSFNNNDPWGRFGKQCYLGTLCSEVEGTDKPQANAYGKTLEGMPGTTNFVPNNVEPVNSLNKSRHVWARYYDVTLHRAGTTTLSKSATIDRLTVDGAATLNITSTGNLKVHGDYNQLGGWTNVNGTLTTGEMFMGGGILSGSGVIDPTYLTVVSGAVAPGGGGVGTLTVKGNMIMSSASGLLIDVTSSGADKLNVIADAGNAGALALNGSLLISQGKGGTARAGDKFVVATAQGGLNGSFVSAGTNSGVLKPKLSYAGNQVAMTLEAGSLKTAAGSSNATVQAFAGALDSLRATSYSKLYNLYGNVDWMNAGQLAATFSALSPVNMVGEVRAMQDRQSQKLLGNVGDRLSLMGTGRAQGISFVGGASALEQSREGLSASAQLGLTEGQAANIAAPGGLSGFVAMGGDTIGSTYGDADRAGSGQHSRYFASGIEAPFGDAMVGTAIGYAETRAMIGQDEASTKLTQAAAYASLPVGKSGYVGGVVAAERSASDSNRMTTDTTSMFRLSGATHSARYMANLEAGIRKAIGSGLYLNPRAQLGFSHYALGGFRETGGETALALDTLKVNRIESRFGARLDGATSLGKWSVRPSLQADYVRLLSGADNGLNVAFAAAPEYSFALPLTGGGSGWMEMKGGVEMSRGKFSLGLTGQATAGDAPLADQRGAVEMKLRF
ncbi:hypothetical protein GCM10023325_14680 [Sphingomonas lutea]